MQIISISRGSQKLGVEFAENLAGKLGYECISREDLLEEATRQRIPVGKLETAIVKPHIYSERLAVEMEHYKALATAVLCERALDHDIVYHGRTGHLLLPGVDNILRIRVVASMEQRLAAVMDRLKLSRKKAKKYIDAVEEDRRKWARKAYNVDWDVLTLYDLLLNLSQVQVSNAASAVCSMAQLPEFQTTPASKNALKDLLLTANAKLALFRNEKTRYLGLKVMASRGILHVTYGYQQAEHIPLVTDLLHAQTEAQEIVCTEAQSNLLWVQGDFDPDDGSYEEVLSLANTWDAAVEIIKMIPREEYVPQAVVHRVAVPSNETWRQTGIIEDEEDSGDSDPEDVSRVYEQLINAGRAGGKRIIEGTQKTLIGAIDRSKDYRLIIFDKLFLQKNAEARMRLTQQWANAVSDSLRSPVVSLAEIRSRYRFGAKQAVHMIVFGVLTALVLYGVLHFQDTVMAFLLREDSSWRILATVCVLFFVPLFAFVYGSAVNLFLRMIRLD